MNATKITTEYDGHQTTFHKNGDRQSYGVNADNPTRTWTVGCRYTIYGGRAVCTKTPPVSPLAQPEPTEGKRTIEIAQAERAFAQAQLQAVLFFVTAFATVEEVAV